MEPAQPSTSQDINLRDHHGSIDGDEHMGGEFDHLAIYSELSSAWEPVPIHIMLLALSKISQNNCIVITIIKQWISGSI